MTRPKPDSKPAPLQKQNSWSPETLRNELWLRRKQRGSRRSTKSLTDEDFDELKACIELGFGFDSPDVESDTRLSNALPALGFYVAVNKSYNDVVSRLSSSSESSPLDSPRTTMFPPGDDPKAIKTRLRQWAQVVACSVRKS